MTQVTHRGLMQAFFFLAILFAAAIPPNALYVAPRPTAEQVAAQERSYREFVIKKHLAKFIVTTYKQTGEVAERIVDAAYREAEHTKLSPLLLLAVIAQESSFSPSAKSGYGAQGLMQVVARIHTKEVAKLHHPAKLWHPESNIATGAAILQRYVKSAGGNLDQALTRYSGNATAYATRVRGHWAQLKTAAASNALDEQSKRHGV